MSASLVGSEMCIRDSCGPPRGRGLHGRGRGLGARGGAAAGRRGAQALRCLLYTSDAADDM
eukprot:3032824-Alexandrium_andersonii.AAC.1